MSKARDEYYNSPPELNAKRAYSYIKKLEQENKEQESIIADLHELKSEKFAMKKKISELEQEVIILTDSNVARDLVIEQLEQQKAELVDVLIRVMGNAYFCAVISPCENFEKTGKHCGDVQLVIDAIEKTTGKTIKEALDDRH